MGNFHFNRFFEVFDPPFLGLSWRSIEQVDAEIIKPCLPDGLDALNGLAGIMCPVHPLQVFIRKGLHANAEAVDAHSLPGPGFLCCDVVRIGFQGDFRIAAYDIIRLDGIQHLVYCFRSQNRGCASSKINGLNCFG